MSHSSEHEYNQPLPEGWETFTLRFNLAGSNHLIDMVRAALEDNEDPDIFIEPDPKNEHDKYALKVMVKRKMFFILKTDFHIGFIPAPLAKIIHKNGVKKIVEIRIRKLNVHDSGKVSIICDLIGPSKAYSDRLKTEIDNCEMYD